MISRLKVESNFWEILPCIFSFNSKNKQKLEQQLTEFFNARQALLMPSARAGIYFLLKAFPQKKVFLPAFTCRAAVEAAKIAGKEAEFVDIDLNTLNMSPVQLEKVIKKDSIILATHQFGIPSEINKIKKISEKNNCILLEDNAAAIGAKVSGKLTGKFSKASVVSFDYSKTLTTGRGGAIIFNDLELFEKVRIISEKELSRPLLGKIVPKLLMASLYNTLTSSLLYRFITFPLWVKSKGFYGDKGKLVLKKTHEYTTDISSQQACLGLKRIKKVSDVVKAHNKIAGYYFSQLKNVKGIQLPELPENFEPALIRFPFLVLNQDKIDFYKKCLAQGLDLGFSFSYSLADDKKRFPNSFFIAEHVLNLPIYSQLKEKDLKKIVSIIKEAAK